MSKLLRETLDLVYREGAAHDWRPPRKIAKKEERRRAALHALRECKILCEEARAGIQRGGEPTEILRVFKKAIENL